MRHQIRKSDIFETKQSGENPVIEKRTCSFCQLNGSDISDNIMQQHLTVSNYSLSGLEAE
jgi:hypothetical protein